MRYQSTRGADAEHPKAFCDILLEGLAPDGGLYLPTSYPMLEDALLARLRGLSYAELAYEIIRLYVDDIPVADLKKIINKAYSSFPITISCIAYKKSLVIVLFSRKIPKKISHIHPVKLIT